MIKNFSKIFALILTLVFSASYYTQTLTFSSTNPAVAAANFPLGSLKVPIYSAKIVASGFNGAGANLSSVSFTPTGTFTSSDITKYQFWYNTTNDLTTAINTGPDITTIPSQGTQVTLSPYNPYLGDGQTWYIWITADIKTSAGAGRTLTVGALSTSNFNFSSGSKTGTMSVGGTQTFGSDSDGDGIPDSTDLDDDNDGILDTTENPCTSAQVQWMHNASSGQSDFATFGDDVTTTSPHFTSASNVTFGAGLDETTDNYAYTYLIRGANTTTFANAKSNNDYAQVSYTPSKKMYLNGINFGYFSSANSPEVNCGNFKMAVEYSTSSAFTNPIILLQDVQVGTMVSGGYTTVNNTINNLLLQSGTTYYFRVYFYDEQNTDPNNRVRLDDLYFPHCLFVDTDNDQTEDYLDLDSDGDNCPDVIEGGANFTSGASYITNNALNTTVNSSGVPAVPSATPTITGYDQTNGQTVNQAYTVNPAAVAGTVGSNQTIVSGSAPSALSLTGSTGTIQWQSSTDNVTFANISGATSSSYSPGTMTSTTYYRAVVSSLGGCSVNTNSVVITVVPNIDSDGDGVPDYQDLDSDNDGILDIVECPQSVVDVNFSVANGNSQTFSAPAADLGFIFDVYTLDNSFTLNINGTNLTTSELQFQPNQTDNVRFFNGDRYGTGSIPQIYTMTGTAANPLVRIIIHKNGTVNMYGSKVSGGQLFPLQLFNGNTFNNITWNKTGSNTIILSQIIQGPTYITGRANGVKNGFCDPDNDGISNQFDLDSDNDGCADALEGDENVTTSQLTANRISGTVDDNGVPNLVNAGGAADIGGDQGQGIGEAYNAAIQSGCLCYKPAQTTGTALDTNHGITALGRAGADNSNWPMVRKGAWTVLEAKTKGFVVNRLTDAQINAIPSADLREGMMVYNITQDCLQINIDGTATGWKCFNTQTCPDL